jgi:hypothetical protein
MTAAEYEAATANDAAAAAVLQEVAAAQAVVADGSGAGGRKRGDETGMLFCLCRQPDAVSSVSDHLNV